MTDPQFPREHEIIRLLLALSKTSEKQGETMSRTSTDAAAILSLVERLLNPNNERVSVLMELTNRMGSILELAVKTLREVSQIRTEVQDLSIRIAPLLELLNEEESLGT